MDNRSKDVRSRNMSNIPSKNTKPEETVRKYLFANGFRYRKKCIETSWQTGYYFAQI